ncbi:hypothetical protein BDV38DRAFT_240862 [Aspergillus pseudotamarii]|uniref:Uncharacterized protein n=1 Tax=Aspergillus pseudotamarii TaxID=132259 RepID=A0A5N6T1M3_ASPPS|nr:uncharacterized protein BDV38DRAFT_240862 [Aspergillus pseudotamarii]KAE8140024.1 hypothetical protein BDV38DRAFT_240862 [Aspergillus pseudotamarii]
MASADSPLRWKHLHKVLSKPGPFSDEDWVPGPETISALKTSKILYVLKGLSKLSTTNVVQSYVCIHADPPVIDGYGY